MADAPTKPIDVTILSGFLGSGKTTLLCHLLASQDKDRVAVLENELGEIAIDDELLGGAEPGRLEVVQGRSCCEARVQFVDRLRAMSERPIDRLFIEATGVAHPGMLAHALAAEEDLRARYRLDGIVTVVDAAHVEAHLGEDGHATEQIAYADAILVNKTDLVPVDAIAPLLERLREINATATYFTTKEAFVPADQVLNLGGFDLSRVERQVTGCHSFHQSKHPTKHAHKIGTVALAIPGSLDVDLFQGWINDFVSARTETLYRAKGIVAIHGQAARLVFHGVHGHFRAAFDRPWGKETPTSRLVFIGQDLDRAEIEEGLASCRV